MDEAEANPIEARRSGRGCTVCAHPARLGIEGQLRDGTSLRDVATLYELSASALHRHLHGHMPATAADRDLDEASTMPEAATACQSAPAAEALQNDPEAAAPEVAQDHRELPAQGQPVIAGCPICNGPLSTEVTRALLGSPMPDTARIAARFRCDPVTVRAHWSHVVTPTPTPAPALSKPTVEPPPAPLPADRAEALRLLSARGAGIEPALIAWARRRYTQFCASWSGPTAAKEAAYRAWVQAAAGQDAAGRLCALTAFVRRIEDMAEQDGHLAGFVAAQARLRVVDIAGQPALGQAGIPFSASHYLGVLAARGVTLTVTEAMTLAARPASALNGIDRQVIAQHRAEIVSALVDVETFGDAA